MAHFFPTIVTDPEKPFVRYGFPILAGISIFLAFETYNFVYTLFFLPFLLHPVRKLPLRRKMIAYLIMAVVTNWGGFAWIRLVAMEFGGVPEGLAYGIVMLFSLTNNLNFLLWGWCERRLDETKNPFLIGLFFAVTEAIFPQIFPWFMGTCLDKVPALYQAADLLGVPFLSFIVIVFIYSPYWLWITSLDWQKKSSIEKKHHYRLGLGITGFWVCIVLYGGWCLQKYDGYGKFNPNSDALSSSSENKRSKVDALSKTVGITIIQPNTRMEQFYGQRQSQQERYNEFDNLLNETKKALAARQTKPDLVVWPEGAIHFPIQYNQRVSDAIKRLAIDHQIFLAVNSIEYAGKKNTDNFRYYNTQWVFGPDGQVVGKYRKVYLLAFGEYIPFKAVIPFADKWLPSKISSFTAGQVQPIFNLSDRIKWLPLLCYEDIIIGYIHRYDHAKADILVNMTNDGWFGRSDASHLHKQMARVRAVEFRKPLIRILNTGVSQIIGMTGDIISKETQQYVRDYINIDIKLPQEPQITLYAVVGNYPLYFVILGTILLLAIRVRRLGWPS